MLGLSYKMVWYKLHSVVISNNTWITDNSSVCLILGLFSLWLSLFLANRYSRTDLNLGWRYIHSKVSLLLLSFTNIEQTADELVSIQIYALIQNHYAYWILKVPKYVKHSNLGFAYLWMALFLTTHFKE